MDALAIADALATKYLAANLTAPSGYPAMRHSTARIPNAIPTSPWVLVILPKGEMTLGSSELNHTMEYHVLFHYAKHSADVARDVTALLAWIGVLITGTWSDMDLGVTGIRKAYTTEYEMSVFTYAGQEFYGWDITVIVDFRESVSFVP